MANPKLGFGFKHDLLATSSLALRNCLMQNPCDISFANIHKSSNKCTPKQITLYQMAINLYAIVNENSIVPSEVVLTELCLCMIDNLRIKLIKKI